MATTNKKSPTASPESERKAERRHRKSYMRLRTVLDALEVAAVRYYLEGETKVDRARRAGQIERQIRPILKELNLSFGAGCPPGLNNCGGCCVPYPCPSEL